MLEIAKQTNKTMIDFAPAIYGYIAEGNRLVDETKRVGCMINLNEAIEIRLRADQGCLVGTVDYNTEGDYFGLTRYDTDQSVTSFDAVNRAYDMNIVRSTLISWVVSIQSGQDFKAGQSSKVVSYSWGHIEKHGEHVFILVGQGVPAMYLEHVFTNESDARYIAEDLLMLHYTYDEDEMYGINHKMMIDLRGYLINILGIKPGDQDGLFCRVSESADDMVEVCLSDNGLPVCYVEKSGGMYDEDVFYFGIFEHEIGTAADSSNLEVSDTKELGLTKDIKAAVALTAGIACAIYISAKDQKEYRKQR